MMKALHDYGFTKTEIDNASEKAFAELQHYKQDIRNKGEEVLKWLDEHDERAIVLAGRPYHIDPEINHGIPDMITSPFLQRTALHISVILNVISELLTNGHTIQDFTNQRHRLSKIRVLS